ncbi:MAG: hypothetical protein IJ580_09365 [Prevotella sp.]|nr:hypothetical protein [Prevotella sp.]
MILKEVLERFSLSDKRTFEEKFEEIARTSFEKVIGIANIGSNPLGKGEGGLFKKGKELAPGGLRLAGKYFAAGVAKCCSV